MLWDFVIIRVKKMYQVQKVEKNSSADNFEIPKIVKENYYTSNFSKLNSTSSYFDPDNTFQFNVVQDQKITEHVLTNIINK